MQKNALCRTRVTESNKYLSGRLWRVRVKLNVKGQVINDAQTTNLSEVIIKTMFEL